MNTHQGEPTDRPSATTPALHARLAHARHELARAVLGQEAAPQDMSLEQIVLQTIATYRSAQDRAGRLHARALAQAADRIDAAAQAPKETTGFCDGVRWATSELRDIAAEVLADRTLLKSLTSDRGGITLELEPAREVLLHMVAAMRSMLDGHGAENYLETEVICPSGPLSLDLADGQNPADSYTLTLQRRTRPTPHDFRLRAEAAQEEVLRLVATWRAEANGSSGTTADDLARRLQQAGYPLPATGGDTGTPAGPADEDPIVAYRSPNGLILRCLEHPPHPEDPDFTPVTAEELENGGICTFSSCGRDVLTTPPARTPADELQRLRAHVARLQADSAALRALRAAGVDNWEGYGDAMARLEDD